MGKLLIPLIPNLRQTLFSDGKFAPKRAVVLFVFMVLIGLLVKFVGVEGTEQIINFTDEVSDMIGYSD
ncbi:hypothetical protein S144_25 [Shewanella sp. phage 1/44]|uniref:hypothetical protein n=1 Tax=Shewanella sp. phage 1/44 TaxID=1458862 RepID=UPI0004F70302|nr:hypothetical protein S144_25 [Shewanella sp. phage 1/44]AHK11739.1 hypothetical protein S144_25 [Shewanella sp. phage 1/44]